MDPRGLVAFIFTIHELAILLAVVVGALVAALSALLLRSASPTRRALSGAAFAISAALLTLATTSRIFHVRALDVEVVRIDE